MLQGRLTRPALLAATTLVLAACAGVDGTDRGAIREAVIEPGITAIDDSKALACSADAQSIMTAMEIHELMDGRPATDEAELVEAGRLREESSLWDVVDGRLVPADEQCGAVPTDIGEIVTGPGPASITPEQYLDSVAAAEIEALGGYDCALEVAEVSIAYGRYVTDTGGEPTSLIELVDRGYLGATLEGWTVTASSLESVPGTPCRGPLDLVDSDTAALDCDTAWRTLEVAIEAYQALTGELPVDEQAMIDAELIRDDIAEYDVRSGEVVLNNSGCEQPELEPLPDPNDCDGEFFRLQIALETFASERGVDAVDQRQLVDGGYLSAPSDLWDVVDGSLTPLVPCEFPQN